VIKLLNLFIELRDAIILVFCILLSLLLIVITDVDPAGPFRQVAYTAVGSFGGALFKVGSYFRLEDEVNRLRQENAELAYKNSQLEDALLENMRLRKLLGFKDESDFDLIAAEVVGQNPHSIFNGLILNEGSNRGIELDDAVLTADGLVGKISLIAEDHAICQVLLDRNSRVSARVQRNREQGIISWDGGVGLMLLYVAKTIEVLPGDVIITSGLSQIYPADIKIGMVTNVSKETEGMFQDITVMPSVDFQKLEEVQITKVIVNDDG
jgi:rod shape-determining protein MreC